MIYNYGTIKNVWDGIYTFSVFQIQLSFIKVLQDSGIPSTASVPLPQHTSDLLLHTVQFLSSITSERFSLFLPHCAHLWVPPVPKGDTCLPSSCAGPHVPYQINISPPESSTQPCPSKEPHLVCLVLHSRHVFWVSLWLHNKVNIFHVSDLRDNTRCIIDDYWTATVKSCGWWSCNFTHCIYWESFSGHVCQLSERLEMVAPVDLDAWSLSPDLLLLWLK